MSCPGCLCDAESDIFFEAAQVPVFCNVLLPDRDQALAAPRADVLLAICHECGLIYNAAFNPDLVQYAPRYENSQHFSPRFRRYAQSLARRLVERYGLRHKEVVEIGCGAGEFLTMLCRLGENGGIGFEPAHDPATDARRSDVHVRILPRAFGPREHITGDLLCCRHVLEHVASPIDFLSNMADSMRLRRGSVLYLEVPNTLPTLRSFGVWDIIYEHCCYFVPASLRRILDRAGFDARVVPTYQGQFLAAEGQLKRHPVSDLLPRPNRLELERVMSFSALYESQVGLWRQTLEDLRRRGDRVVVWGCGSKGVTFLNVLSASVEDIPCVVDVNPRKQGKFVPGTGQEVISPAALERIRPTVVLAMNPIYLREIRRLLSELDVDAQLMVAWPDAPFMSKETPSARRVELPGEMTLR